MKKTIILTIAMLSVIYLSAQVISFSVQSSKTYENSSITSYLLLDADLDMESVMIVEKELEQHPDISRFSFYANPNLTKCMFTTNISSIKKLMLNK